MKKQKQIYKKQEWELLVKYYQICFNSPKKIFYDLKECLKLNCVWIIACKNILQNRKFSGLRSLVLNPLILIHLKTQVLAGQFKWINCFTIQLKPSYLNLFIEFCNQLVQEVLRIVIEPIFDKTFEPTSFGFRFNRKTKVALNYLLTQIQGANWVIQGDLKGFFNTINESRLISFLHVRIKDPIIINLIKEGLKLKIFNSNYSSSCFFGIPLGGGLSPLLSNIYLDSLDKEIKILGLKCLNYNLNYNKTSRFVHYNCFKYLRFGDDFLIGINSSFLFASTLKQQIIQYLQLHLDIMFFDNRFKIVDLSKGISFLGFIWQKCDLRNKVSKNKSSCSILKIDAHLVILSLSSLKFCDGKGKSLPFFNYLHFSQYEINIKVNKILLFLCNWWALASNRKYMMSYVSAIIKSSLAKMYAAKYKLKTTAAVLKKGGIALNKAIGNEKKSAIGWLQKDKILIPKLLYTYYHQIPKKENPVDFNVENTSFKILRKTDNFISLLQLLKKNSEFNFLKYF